MMHCPIVCAAAIQLHKHPSPKNRESLPPTPLLSECLTNQVIDMQNHMIRCLLASDDDTDDEESAITYTYLSHATNTPLLPSSG